MGEKAHLWSFPCSLEFILFEYSGTSLDEQGSQDQTQTPPTLAAFPEGAAPISGDASLEQDGGCPRSLSQCNYSCSTDTCFPLGSFPILRCFSSHVRLIHHQPSTHYLKIKILQHSKLKDNEGAREKRTKHWNSEDLDFNPSFAIFWWPSLAEVTSVFQADGFSTWIVRKVGPDHVQIPSSSSIL